jgi:hypothetical protein
MKLFRQNLDTINRLLKEMAEDPDRAIRAYSLGVISYVAERRNQTAPDSLLEMAAECKTMEELHQFYLEWVEEPFTEAGNPDNAGCCPDKAGL